MRERMPRAEVTSHKTIQSGPAAVAVAVAGAYVSCDPLDASAEASRRQHAVACEHLWQRVLDLLSPPAHGAGRTSLVCTVLPDPAVVHLLFLGRMALGASGCYVVDDVVCVALAGTHSHHGRWCARKRD